MPKGHRSFAWAWLIFLSMFCPELQKLPKLIYDFTRKGRHFIWGKDHLALTHIIKSKTKPATTRDKKVIRVN